MAEWRRLGAVPALDELEDRHARFGLGVKTATVEQLAFERGEKAPAHRVVQAITDRTHRGLHTSLAAAHSKGDRRVLGGFKRSSQYLDGRNWDDYSKAPLGSIWASSVAVAGTAAAAPAPFSVLRAPTRCADESPSPSSRSGGLKASSSTTARYRKPAQVGI